MMPALRILADGVEWPLETFLDAYGFSRLDGRPPEAQHGRVDVVTDRGELRCGCWISDVEWSAVIAAKAESSQGVEQCAAGCGQFVDHAGFMCSECEGCAEW